MKSLDHGTNHFPDLVVQKALTFQIKVHELQRPVVFFISHFKSVLIDIHIVVGSQLNHKPLRCCVFRPHFFGVIVILLSSSKRVLPELVQLCFLVLRQTV